MRTIAHISDLHFGRQHKEAAEALLRDLAEMKPSLIAVSGDLTQRALRKQFHHARRYLERLPAPFMVVPGNHDIPLFDVTRRMFLPLHRYKNYITRDLRPIFVDEEIAIIGINSATSLALEGGRMTKKQLAWATGVFAGVPDHCFRIVVTHHPFLKPPGVSGFRRVIRPAKKALDVFASCGVDLLLCGHFHRMHAEDVTKHHASVARPIIHVQAGTALSSKVEMNCERSYNLITLEENRMTIEARAWRGATFEPAERDEFVRIKGAWRRK